jgi:hypothetical protein
MSTPSSANVYTQSFGTKSILGPVISDVSPGTTYSPNWQLGQEWINKSNDTIYVLSSITTSDGLTIPTWTETSGGGAGGLKTINTVGPDGGGNFTLESTDGSITFTDIANGLNLSATGNDLFLTKYVVDAAGDAPYTTIQSAIVTANGAGGGQVVVRDGTYTEDLTMLPNVNLQGMNTDGLIAGNAGYGVNVIGNHFVDDTSGPVIFSVSNISFTTSSGQTWALASTANAVLCEFLFCSVQNSDPAGVCFALSTAGSSVTALLNNCICIADNSVGTLSSGCQLQHVNTAIIQAGAPAYMVSGGTLEIKNCYIQAGIILNSTGGSSILQNSFLGASNQGVLFTGSGNVLSNNNVWTSEAGSGFYVDGSTGNYSYGNDQITGTATKINPAITVTNPTWGPPAKAVAASGDATQGVCYFNSADFTVDDTGFVSATGSSTDALITIYVVDNTNPAPYTTVQSAINAANAAGGGVVAIRPSATPYTENLSMLSNVMLTCIGQDGFFPGNGAYGVSIIGNHTVNDTAGETFVQASGINFSSTTGVVITISAATTVAILEFNQCFVSTADGSDAIVTSSTGGGAVFQAYALSALSSGNILNVGANTEAQIIGCPSLRSSGTSAFNISGNLNIYDSTVDSDNTAFVMTSGGVRALGNQIVANTSGVDFGTSGGGFSSYNNVWDCGGPDYISGTTGTYAYANDILLNADQIQMGITVEVQTWHPVATATATSMGAKPGTCYFNSADFTVDDTGFVQLVGGPNDLYLTLYVVDQAGNAPYTDIQSAINAANTAGGGIVAIRQSTTPYIQNVNFLPLVNICTLPTQGFTIDQGDAGVTIQGNHTISDTAGFNSITIDGINFTAPTGSNLAMSAASSFAGIGFTKCAFNNTDGSPLITQTSTGGAVNLIANDCYFFASGSVMTAGANCNNEIVQCNLDANANAFILTSASLSMSYSFMDTTGIGFELATSANLTLFANSIESDAGGILFDDNTSSADINGNLWNCGGTYVYAGSTGGTIFYGDENYTSTSAIDPALTLNPRAWRPRATAGTSGNAYAGTASFDDTYFTVTDGFVTLNGTAAPRDYTAVDSSMSPYTVLATDDFISCDTSAGTVTLLFPNSPTMGEVWTVKDRLGTAATNAISYTTIGGTVTIDTVTTYTNDTNFQANDLLFNGTSYEVF